MSGSKRPERKSAQVLAAWLVFALSVVMVVNPILLDVAVVEGA